MKIKNLFTRFSISPTKWFITSKDDYQHHAFFGFFKIISFDRKVAYRLLLGRLNFEFRFLNQRSESFPEIPFRKINPKNKNIFNGCYLKRISDRPFKVLSNKGLAKSFSPTIQIKNIEFVNVSNKEIIVITEDGTHQTRVDAVEIISKERADFLNNMWNECTVSETNDTEFSHIREDTKEPKIGFSLESGRRALFHHRITNPTAIYNLYKCNTCLNFHIGKQTAK